MTKTTPKAKRSGEGQGTRILFREECTVGQGRILLTALCGFGRTCDQNSKQHQ